MFEESAKNIDNYTLKADDINFSISYKANGKRIFVLANCLSDIVCGTEKLSVVDDDCWLTSKGELVVLHTDVVGG